VSPQRRTPGAGRQSAGGRRGRAPGPGARVPSARARPVDVPPRAGHDPGGPGVYKFRDERGRVIYVGKAKNLRQRLNSYFSDRLHHARADPADGHSAASVEWTVVSTEVEALQLEYTWIKQFDPRFNVRYRDDKSYPYLAVTLDEEYPRLQVMRGAKRKGVRYFGPYAHAWAIRETLDLLLRVFPARTCSAGCSSGRPDRPALPARLHRQVLGAVRRPGHGRGAPGHRGRTSATSWPARPTDDRRLETEMAAASAELEFERAARLRDDIGALRRALEKQAVVLRRRHRRDVVAFAEDALEAAVQVFHVRGGRVRGSAAGWWTRSRTSPPATWSSTSACRSTAATTPTRAARDPGARAAAGPRGSAAGCGAARRPGDAAGAAARGQAGAAGDRRPQRRAGLPQHKLKRATT
jgi:excinuclease ABC subunit C